MEILKREYREAWRFLMRLKQYIIISASLYILAAVAAYFVSAAVYSKDAALIKEHLEIFNGIIDSTGVADEQGNLNAVTLFFYNFRAASMAIGAGMMPFVFAPIFNCVTNGAVIGIMLSILHATSAGGITEMAVSILPHGVFEITALLLSIAFGLKLCAEVNSAVSAKSSIQDVFQYVSEMARAIVLTVLPLLILAALTESYITPVFIERFIK